MSGSTLQVPNEKLMTMDINNITESKVMQDRIVFEVDTSVVHPEAMADLSSCVHEVIKDENVQHLYDQDFVPYAAMLELRNPLKYEVCLRALSLLRCTGNARLRHTNSHADRYACHTVLYDALQVKNCRLFTMQVIVVYQLAFNGEKHARVCEARTFITHCIGCWLAAWRVSHTLSRVPLLEVDPSDIERNAGKVDQAHALAGACE
jgi:hypothetical protein